MLRPEDLLKPLVEGERLEVTAQCDGVQCAAPRRAALPPRPAGKNQSTHCCWDGESIREPCSKSITTSHLT